MRAQRAGEVKIEFGEESTAPLGILFPAGPPFRRQRATDNCETPLYDWSYKSLLLVKVESLSNKMAGPPRKRQKREAKEDGSLPQKKYYRQRAHANPFSDHDLT